MTFSLRYWTCCVLIIVVRGHFRVQPTDMDIKSNQTLPIFAQRSAMIDQGMVTASVSQSGQIVVEHLPKMFNDQHPSSGGRFGSFLEKDQVTSTISTFLIIDTADETSRRGIFKMLGCFLTRYFYYGAKKPLYIYCLDKMSCDDSNDVLKRQAQKAF